jgi:hypothetical protein
MLPSITADPAAFAATLFDLVVVGGGTAGLVVAARLGHLEWVSNSLLNPILQPR